MNDRATICILKENLQAKDIVYCNLTFTYNYHNQLSQLNIPDIYCHGGELTIHFILSVLECTVLNARTVSMQMSSCYLSVGQI